MTGRVRAVAKQKYVIFVRRSEEFESAVSAAAERGHSDAAVSNAIHAAISIADALSVYYLGQRSAAQRHEESLRLLLSLTMDAKDLDRNVRHLTSLLELKSAAEYDERSVTASEAKAARNHMSRFLEWARARLPRT